MGRSMRLMKPVLGHSAEQLGPIRDFYSTGIHAEDLESVRAALGFVLLQALPHAQLPSHASALL